MKSHLLTVLLSLCSTAALAQTPEVSASTTETGKTTPTTQPAEAPKAEEPKKDTPSSWTDKVKLSAKAYLRYSYELGEAARNANQFNIDRLYFQAEFLATERVRFQITLDAGDTRNATGNQVFFAETKSAFIEVKDVLAKGLYLRAGVLPLAWIPYEEDLWGYRVQGPLAMDRWGYVISSDIGLAVGGNLPSKYGSFQVDVVNGEGYKSLELNKRKELQARLSLNPLASMGGLPAGLFVTGYGSFGEYDDTGLAARAKSRVIAQVGLQSAPVTVAAAYVVARDSNSKVSGRYTVSADSIVSGKGLYGFAVVNVGELAHLAEGVDLFARYDHLDPDKDLAKDDVDLLIAGVGYRWNKNVKSLVDYEAVDFAADVGGVDANRPGEKRVKLQTEFRF